MSITESFETFTGQEPVATWTAHVGVFSSVKKMGEEERLLFALQHISDDVRGCVMSLAGPLEKITGEAWNWDWLKFKVALKAIEDQFKEKGLSTEDTLMKAVKVTAVAGAACIAGPALLSAGLGLIGFSAIGPVAGFIATGAQSTVYGGAVGAGSLFAFCQSLAMGGTGAVALAAGLSGAGAAAAATIEEIKKETPSKTWENGAAFRPSIKVINALLEIRSNLSEK